MTLRPVISRYSWLLIESVSSPAAVTLAANARERPVNRTMGRGVFMVTAGGSC
jgi:hypothetical protein